MCIHDVSLNASANREWMVSRNSHFRLKAILLCPRRERHQSHGITRPAIKLRWNLEQCNPKRLSFQVLCSRSSDHLIQKFVSFSGTDVAVQHFGDESIVFDFGISNFNSDSQWKWVRKFVPAPASMPSPILYNKFHTSPTTSKLFCILFSGNKWAPRIKLTGPCEIHWKD